MATPNDGLMFALAFFLGMTLFALVMLGATWLFEDLHG